MLRWTMLSQTSCQPLFCRMQGLLLEVKSLEILFFNRLVETMKKGGHEVVAVIKSHAEVMKMLEHAVLSEQLGS